MKILNASDLSSLVYLKDFSSDLKYKILNMVSRENFIEDFFDLMKENDVLVTTLQDTIKENKITIGNLEEELEDLKIEIREKD